jgi:hypothetical protein
MLQAAPALTPNLVKAILEYTAQRYDGYDALTQGAGFLDAHGAIELARALAAPGQSLHPIRPEWSRQITWGNHRVAGGRLTRDAGAWSPDVVWGDDTRAGGPVTWGVIRSSTLTSPGEWTTWGTSCLAPSCESAVWDNTTAENVVWGLTCGGADCPDGAPVWFSSGAATSSTTSDTQMITGTSSRDNDTVVWGTTCEADQPCEW